MTRTLSVAVTILSLVLPARSQTLGLLALAGANDFYAGGHSVAPSHGLSAGVFIPFYVFDRFVLRTEAGVCARSGLHTAADAAFDRPRSLYFRTTVLGRYYVARRAAISLGAQCEFSLTGPEHIAIGHAIARPQRMDMGLVAGAAYRLNQRLELGCRFVQGVSAALDMGPYGIGRQRSAALSVSYLLHSRHPRFRQVRMWRDPSFLRDRY